MAFFDLFKSKSNKTDTEEKDTNTITINNKQIHTGASLGGSLHDKPVKTEEDLIKMADQKGLILFKKELTGFIIENEVDRLYQEPIFFWLEYLLGKPYSESGIYVAPFSNSSISELGGVMVLSGLPVRDTAKLYVEHQTYDEYVETIDSELFISKTRSGYDSLSPWQIDKSSYPINRTKRTLELGGAFKVFIRNKQGNLVFEDRNNKKITLGGQLEISGVTNMMLDLLGLLGYSLNDYHYFEYEYSMHFTDTISKKSQGISTESMYSLAMSLPLSHYTSDRGDIYYGYSDEIDKDLVITQSTRINMILDYLSKPDKYVTHTIKNTKEILFLLYLHEILQLVPKMKQSHIKNFLNVFSLMSDRLNSYMKLLEILDGEISVSSVVSESIVAKLEDINQELLDEIPNMVSTLKETRVTIDEVELTPSEQEIMDTLADL